MKHFRPRSLALPLELAVDLVTGASEEFVAFVRERLRLGDPGPLEISEGVASTPAWDLAIVRTGLCVVLRRRGGLEVVEGEDD